MTGNHVMLLGGEGFIGSALFRKFRAAHRPVHVVGRKNIVELESLLPKCATVIHLASNTTPGSSANHAQLEDDNLRLTRQLVNLVREHPGKQLIYFSSGGAVYGNRPVLPVIEDDALAPLSHYGAAKIEQEGLCTGLRDHGVAVTLLRPSNAYGPGQSLRSGFGLVRTLLEHARERTPIEIWGDGNTIRDYIYIDDAAEAVSRIAESPEIQGVFNMGSGQGYSINEVKSIVERVCKVSIDASYKHLRHVDVRTVVLDTSRLRAQLAWEPRIPLEEGIARTWTWLQET